VIRNGYVITMDASTGDLPRGDVHVDGGRIAAARPTPMPAFWRCPVSVSISPFSELLTGCGMPRTAQFLAADAAVGLSVDTTVLTGNADMFAIMKVTQAIANGVTGDEFALSPRRTLELATIEGARSLGLAGQTGSLTPGKRADLIGVDTAAPNLAVLTDPAHLLVTAAQPANVDTVIVDGRVLKRGGVLTAMDAGKVSADARQALAGVRARAGA
jgi:5-methylthioadenosine/S-adenosylhomocysteine deaminase